MRHPLPGLVLLLATACAPATPPPAEDRDPALAVLDQDMRGATLAQLEAARRALEGRDDLGAIDRRRALELAWLNRAPTAVDPDHLDGVPPEHAARERALRQAWQQAHIAYSWDNLDPAAQLEPRPAGLHLTWLVLAHALPLARNQQPFEEPWISDYYARKAWYVPRAGPLRLSMIDRVQLDRLDQEVRDLDRAQVQALADSLPADGMSPGEAQLEARLAERWLAGGTLFEDPSR
ncbi:MAG: hypothetical protein ABIO70_10805 [Pseudomonadota bacterium]